MVIFNCKSQNKPNSIDLKFAGAVGASLYLAASLAYIRETFNVTKIDVGKSAVK